MNTKSKLFVIFLVTIIPFFFSCPDGEDYSSIEFKFNFVTGFENQSVDPIFVKYYDHFDAPIMNTQDTDIVRQNHIFYGWTTYSEYVNPDYISTIIPQQDATEDEWNTFGQKLSDDRGGMDQEAHGFITFFGHHGLKRGDEKQACDFRLKATDDWNVTFYAMWVPESVYYKVVKINSTTYETLYEPEDEQQEQGLNAIIIRQAFCNDFEACPRTLSIPSNLKNDSGVNVAINAIADDSWIGFLNVEELVIPSTVAYLGSSSIPKAVKSIDLPSSVVKISDRAFEQSDELETIIVDEGNQNYSSDAGVLYNKDKSSIVSFPKNKQDYSEWNMPNTVNLLEPYSFYGAPFESINIPEGVTSIGAYAFCQSKLTTIIIPSTVTEFVASTTGGEGSVFVDCDKLISVQFNANVTELLQRFFADCSALEQITLPASITKIDGYVFDNCTNLTQISFGGMVAQYKAIDRDVDQEGHPTWHNGVPCTTVQCDGGSCGIDEE